MSRVEQIWFKDPVKFLTDTEALLKFIPNASSSLEEQLNSAFRFSLYFGVLVAILRNDARAVFFPVFVGLFTIFIYNYEMQKRAARAQVLEKMSLEYDQRKNKACLAPTAENPFMNVLMTDYTQFPNRPQACNLMDRKIKKKVRELASDPVPIDADDVTGKKAAEMHFYTMPSTSIPNDQSGFATWLYQPPKSIKEAGVLNLDW